MKRISLNALCLSILFAQLSLGEASKPNVIFILMDDMGYSDVSCYGAKKVKTPHIDKLAAGGLRFTDFHTGSSICSPSRAAFLTGAYPQRSGLYMGINENREAHWFLGLNPDEVTLAEQFKKQGYKTLMIGKWHLGTEPEFSYYKQGFDHYYGAPSNMGHNPEFLDERKLVYKKVPIEKLTALYTARIVKQIGQYKDQPFFLYYAHNYPHIPVKPGAAFKGSSKDGPRGDAIQEIDWGIGQIVSALEENGILENTLIIFTSDNGPNSQRHAAPYSGTKYVTLEGGHRVPFILYWKGKITKPAVLDVPTNAMDLFPTLSKMIGAPIPKDRVYDGVSLTPTFDQKPIARSENTPFFYYNCENLQAVRVGKWKLHLPRTKNQVAWWDKNKKFFNLAKPVLYNLDADPAETKNVALANPEVVQRILGIAANTRKELGEYGQRGSGQRATGSIIADVPIVSNFKTDWPKVDAATRAKVAAEHSKWHPDANQKTEVKQKKRRR